MSDTATIPLHSKRRVRAAFAQHLQHAIPAFGLATTGLRALSAGAHGFELVLAIAEVVTSTILVAAIVRHTRHRRAGHHHGSFDWVTLFAAAMLLTEAGEKWNRTGRLWTPEALTAIATLVTAAVNTVAARRGGRYRLEVSSEGITIFRSRIRGRFQAAWNDITSIEIGDRKAVINTQSGSRGRINLADLHNAADVVSVLREAQARLPAAAID
jgi:hypothetical protein